MIPCLLNYRFKLLIRLRTIIYLIHSFETMSSFGPPVYFVSSKVIYSSADYYTLFLGFWVFFQERYFLLELYLR